MKITVITVTYNSEKYLDHCIQSVLKQDYDNIEYIIVDGASTDRTHEIVQAYGSSVFKFISEPDDGIYDAMNKGINLATGDVIGILNSDDMYADTRVLSDVMGHFINEPKLDLLYGDLVYVQQKDINSVVRKWNSKAYYKRYFEHGNVPPHPALFIKAGVYKVAGIFDLQFRLAADYEIMLRIFKKHDFRSKYISRLMIRMRLGGATNKSVKNIILGNKEILRAWKRNQLRAPLSLVPYRIIKRISQFF